VIRAAAPASALAAPPYIAAPSATGVPAQLVLAGPGARSIAFVLDFLIRGCLALGWLLLSAWLILGNLDFVIPEDHETLWYLGGVIPAMAIYFLYHVVLEPLMDGRTPGKRMTGLRVLTSDGIVPSTAALVTRNVFRIVDSLPALYVVGLLFIMFGRRHARTGDLAAGTVVAVERAPFLEQLAARAGAAQQVEPARQVRQRAQTLGARGGGDVDEALAVVEGYRSLARELGASRHRSQTLTPAAAEHLEAAYAELHGIVQRPPRRFWLAAWSLFRDQVPAAMHAIRWHLLAVTLLFVISTVAGFTLIYLYPDLIAMFASPQLIATVERGELWTDSLLNVTPSAVLSVSILTNNIVVSIFAFCSGIVFTLGTFYIVGLNGFSLGAIFALTAQHGLAGRLFDFVVAHGCVELSCICISGAAGSYIGEALIRPRTHSRSEAFRLAARDGIRILVAVTLLLLVCGFIEGYVSPDLEVPRWARVTIGVGYWLFMISLLRGYVFGRSRGGDRVPT
jgi:uncharacterized membrane protein SpoIIM required for sporulation/uncharacterized RDD family membrane protein YckC